MLSCKDIARLVSDSLDRKLPPRQRLELRLHLMMCGACSTYRRQITELNRLFQRRFHDATGSRSDDAEPSPPRCPEEAKERIEAWLKQRLND